MNIVYNINNNYDEYREAGSWVQGKL